MDAGFIMTWLGPLSLVLIFHILRKRSYKSIQKEKQTLHPSDHWYKYASFLILILVGSALFPGLF